MHSAWCRQASADRTDTLQHRSGPDSKRPQMRGRAKGAEIVYVDTNSTLGATPARNLIDVAAWRRRRYLVLDLTGVTFLSASGVQVLLEARGTAALTYGRREVRRCHRRPTETAPRAQRLRPS